ncbi:MAG TPA: glycoside hydrolase family 2 TIM barrel-domain containing protein, partial [Spirochaetia bacterium]|nr:glycoside hydrolase family 2 TIM barrel-domain containing protein [Spirochaetia bacterium]
MIRETTSLAGSWQFALDPANAGVRERWYSRSLGDTIQLPGTTDEAKKGEFADERCDDRLSRVWRWIGPAWYQRTLEVPDRWAGMRLMLFIERTKDSQVWVDDAWVGSSDSLSTPHRFDLSNALTPGAHRLTVLVDNAKLPPVGPCHQVDERTQTNWNGIVGRLELQVSEPVWIDDLRLYPHGADRRIRVVASICNHTRSHASVVVTMRAVDEDRGTEYDSVSVRGKIDANTRGVPVEHELVLPDHTRLWDEFDRSLVRVTVETAATLDDAPDGQNGNGKPPSRVVHDVCSSICGMRDFAVVGSRLTINERPIFLRGKHDAALFPLTGYAPMDKAEWLRLLGISAAHGMNHYRFHSWCPPEAAFQAADELGIYFQAELPNKRPIVAPGDPDRVPPAAAYETLEELAGDGGDPTERTTYLIREGERILREYGNHPSFVMMTLGNELDGDEAVMKSMCDRFRALDARHLYSLGTHHHNDDPHLTDGDDFWVTAETGPGRSVRGASFQGRSPGHVDNLPASTVVNYNEALKDIPIPVIAHEMAQYEVYPDYSEIPKYVGVTRARNLEIFRDRLEAAGMLDQAADFFRASGALSAICHREDVEAALRTRGFGGFQM